jgi:N-methylhydantoinase A
VARAGGYSNIITFDMGGTSTDVALCENGIRLTHESSIDGMPVGIPMIDIHTVGAGGGSIAEVDPGGSLKVGPESSGADPGPISYGKGGRFTVTDANVVLGRLLPRFFLGGAMRLAVDRVRPAVARLEWTRGWKSIEAMSQGVIDVVNSNMEQAIRLISVERGYDPRDFALFSFGGAGGLHAADLAGALGIPRVIVPRFPGALSALGLLLADARKDYSRSLLVDVTASAKRVQVILDELHNEGIRELSSEGFRRSEIRYEDFVDLRYSGQSYELTIPLVPNVVKRFHESHERRYGYLNPGKPVEIVNVRTTMTGRVRKPAFPEAARVRGKPVADEMLPVWMKGKWRKTAIYDRSVLAHGHTIEGPAIIGEYSSTTLVPPGCRCSVDAGLNLVLTTP